MKVPFWLLAIISCILGFLIIFYLPRAAIVGSILLVVGFVWLWFFEVLDYKKTLGLE